MTSQHMSYMSAMNTDTDMKMPLH